MKKERLDVILVKKEFFKNRKMAQSMILAGNVLVNNKKVFKAGEKFSVDLDVITLLNNENTYSSIGGLKLEKLCSKYDVSFEKKSVIDIGASTGGFTDYALKHGASEVLAIDVGYGIIDWQLRVNPKVKLLEKCNFRYFVPEQKFDVVLIDVSFISIKLLISNIIKCMHDDSIFIPLIKPQFEAGPDAVSKKGILKSSSEHKKILFDLIELFKYNNLFLKAITWTALKKHKGNIEYIALFDKDTETFNNEENKKNDYVNNFVNDVVNKAFNEVNYK